MPRVLPSEVVAIIDQMTAGAGWILEVNPNVQLEQGHMGMVATLLDLVEQVPKELVVISGEKYFGLLAAMSALRSAVGAWQVENRYRIATLPGFKGVHVLILIRRALAACPDEFPAVGTNELAFIDDPQLRDSLRLDVSAANRALANEEWKAATVLAGSVVEALLLWALQKQSPESLQAKAEELKAARRLKRATGGLEDLGLGEYVELAEAVHLIGTETATQVRLAKDYRNLIHPGRTVRLQRVCDRGTALAAAAAIEDVVRDFRAWA